MAQAAVVSQYRQQQGSQSLFNTRTCSGAAHCFSRTCLSPSSTPHHLSFSFTSFCRGKCVSLQFVQLSQRDGRRSSWSFWCSTQPCPEPPHEDRILQASTMEEIYDTLARRLLLAVAAIPPSSKYIVGLAGPPGAGKSTVAKEVAERLNALWLQTNPRAEREKDHIAITLPMDGFHLYRSQLDMMEDPVEAHARRGAPWTFDPDGLLKCLNSLRSQGWVHAPSFDHGVGDPKEKDIIVTRSSKEEQRQRQREGERSSRHAEEPRVLEVYRRKVPPSEPPSTPAQPPTISSPPRLDTVAFDHGQQQSSSTSNDKQKKQRRSEDSLVQRSRESCRFIDARFPLPSLTLPWLSHPLYLHLLGKTLLLLIMSSTRALVLAMTSKSSAHVEHFLSLAETCKILTRSSRSKK